MRDDRKTKAQLLEELAELHRKVATLEETRADWERTAEPFRVAKDLERIFNLSLDLICVAGFDGYYKWVNPAFERILGWTEEESLSRPFMEFIHPDDRPAAEEHMRKLAAGAEVVCFEDRDLCKDGSVRWLSWAVVPIKEEGVVYGVGRDITEQKRAEEALRISEQNYREIFNGVNDIIVIHDPESGAVLEVNARAREAFGYSPEDKEGPTFSDFCPGPPFTPEKALEMIRKAASEGPQVFEWLNRRRDGTTFWVEVNLKPAVIGGQRRLLAVARDIMRRKQAEEALRKARDELEERVEERTAALRDSEEKYRALAEKVNDIPYSLDLDGRFTYIGPQVARYGSDPQEILGQSYLEFVDSEDRQRVADDFQRSLTTGEEFPTVFRVRTADGRTFWLEDEGRMRRDESGRIVGMTGILRDVTERKAAEQAVLEEQRRLRRLLSMYERDRQLVAYEIHDGFTQPLAGALMQLEGGLQLATSRYPDIPLESCESALELLRKSIEEARRLMGGLRPAVLEEFGVVAAIENLLDEQRRRTGATIEVTGEVDFDRLEDPLELAIFRIVQEAVANAVNHSDSERIRVALVQQGDRLRIEVQDEGAGFDPARVESGCFGLEGIRVRARLFGGDVTIQSSPGQGTHLVVELPLVEREPDAPDGSTP